jgi:DMSO/TMAO reductase YedYZ molybdopterin-dependent catalytic subunit
MGRSTDPVFGEPGQLTVEELQLATRNHGLPLEALRYPLTPAGLHYLLIHYDVPAVDADTWSLEIGGAVTLPRRLTLEELRSRTRATLAVTMECAGNGRALMDPRPLSQPWLHEAVGTAEWSGAPLGPLLDEAGLDSEAREIVFTGLDRGVEGGIEQFYARALPLDEARRPEVLLAYEMNGQPLLPQHGAPVRVVVPGWYGMANVKWLSSISVVSEPFRGYQQERSYRFRLDPDEPGMPMQRIRPRALMIPPGIPDFFTRRRVLPMGPCRIAGRAWSGMSPISAVEVSDDDGASWTEARLEPAGLGPWAWRSWIYDWQPSATGEHVLCCRARDTDGAQTDAPGWNVGGYANPAPQRVMVTVEG